MDLVMVIDNVLLADLLLKVGLMLMLMFRVLLMMGGFVVMYWSSCILLSCIDALNIVNMYFELLNKMIFNI